MAYKFVDIIPTPILKMFMHANQEGTYTVLFPYKQMFNLCIDLHKCTLDLHEKY